MNEILAILSLWAELQTHNLHERRRVQIAPCNVILFPYEYDNQPEYTSPLCSVTQHTMTDFRAAGYHIKFFPSLLGNTIYYCQPPH
jgi:hypothetical protein